MKTSARICILSLGVLAGVQLANAQNQATATDQEAFLRQVLLRNPAIQAESLSVAGSQETRSGATSLLLPQFAITGKLSGISDLDESRSALAQAGATVSQILPTGGTLQGQALTQRAYTATNPVATPAYSDTARLVAQLLGVPLSTGAKSSSYTRDSLGLGVSFTQPLLRGFGDGAQSFYQIDQARANVKIQIHSSRAQVLATVGSARKAWWNQLSQEALWSARIQDTIRTDKLLKVARQKLSIGVGTVLDTLQAYADHLQARSDCLLAWTNARSSAIDLGTFLDTAEMWIHPVPDTTIALPIPPKQDFGSADALLKQAEANSPDLAQALALEERARSEELFRKRETLPTLDAGVFARKALLPDMTFAQSVNYGGQVNLLWNIPDGVNRASARKALLDLRKTGIQAAKARKDIHRTLQRLLDQSTQRNLALDLSSQVLAAQQARLSASLQGYKDGSVSWTDVLSARRDWMNAIVNSWTQMASLQATITDLQSLTGTGPASLGWSWGE
jgi:outer membrane protein TolC